MKPITKEDMNMSDVVLETNQLSKSYNDFEAVKGVSFKVHRGEVLGFLGPNGAGKSTTMKMLTCFISPSGGSAKINGYDIFDDPIKVREAIGYLPESTPLYTEMLVIEYLEFIANMRGYKGEEAKSRIQKVVTQTGLQKELGKEIRALSKGYKQRVGLAQALIHEPPILILDEPMSGLDPNQAAEIRDLIKEIGKERTVILSTHNLAEVQLTCNRVLIISNGQLVANDTPSELQKRAGKPTFIVQIQSQNADEVKKQYESLPEVSGVQVLLNESDEITFEVTPTSADHDIRPALFQAAAQNNLILVGLRKEGKNLEQIFRDLTSNDPSSTSSTQSDTKAA